MAECELDTFTAAYSLSVGSDLACQEESNEHDAHEDDKDEDSVAEEEEEQERATALTTAQANRRQRVTSWRRHMMEMDSDDE